MQESLKRYNTICVIILSFLMFVPVFIWLFTDTPFVDSYQLFPLDLSLYYAILLGGVIVNYTLNSAKLLVIIMIAAVFGLFIYYFIS